MESDRAVLEALYHATDGPNWGTSDNWLSDLPLSDWWGVWTDEQGRVRYLALEGNRLSGPIPSALGRLANLEGLALAGNALSGPIPPELGQLANLRGNCPWADFIPGLDLSRNQLSGPIPSELGRLTNLEGLCLNDNQLSGPIPAELGRLTNLDWLDLEQNQLGGPIPPELGRLANLTRLHLSHNQLSGPIPSELGQLTNLRGVSLGNNQLSGPIPSELGRLTNLFGLHLYDNRLSGPIPPELGQMVNVSALSLAGNQLSGPIPLELGNLTGLEDLSIDGDTGLCLPPAIQETAFGRLAVGNDVPLCDAAPSVTPKAPAVVQQAVNDAIASATNAEGLRTGGASVTVPLDALFTFPSSVARQATYAGAVFSASSTVPGVVSVSTTPDGPGVVLTPGAGAGSATVTVEARPEGQPDAAPLASVAFGVEVTRAPSMDATLSGLVLSDGTGEVGLEPVFDPGTQSYRAGVANVVTSVTVTATVADDSATVTVNGAAVASDSPSAAIDLEVGDNVIAVVVVAEDGATTLTYTVTVTRAPATNAMLSGLVLSDGTGEVGLEPVFEPGTQSYRASVANVVTSVTVTATAADDSATVTVNGVAAASGSPSAAIDLAVGETVIAVVVVAEDGATTLTYTVTVTRAPATNAMLSGLVLSDGTGEVGLEPVFEPGTQSYTASVANVVTSVTVTATVADDSATVTVNGVAVVSGSPSAAIDLEEIGDTVIAVVVTAQDGTTTLTYTVTVTRATVVPVLPFGSAVLLGIVLMWLGGRSLVTSGRSRGEFSGYRSNRDSRAP